MSNMSYCRFQNTASDLLDCAGALEEMLTGAAELVEDEDEDGNLIEVTVPPKKLSRDEFDALVKMMETIGTITEALEAEGISPTDHDLRSKLAPLFLEQK